MEELPQPGNGLILRSDVCHSQGARRVVRVCCKVFSALETAFRVKDSGTGHSRGQAKGLLVDLTEVGSALLVVTLTLKLASFCPLWFSKACLSAHVPAWF